MKEEADAEGLSRRELVWIAAAIGAGLPFGLRAQTSGTAPAPPASSRWLEAAEKAARWIQAEHRIKPDYVYAQTSYMQGAAGIGILLLHLDAVEHGKEWAFRLPDMPY
jgi:hypothetical protein